MANEMAGKVVIVTGGARGLGQAMVELIVEEGGQVIIADLRDDEGEALARSLGGAVRFRRSDVSSRDDMQALIDFAVSEFGGLHAMVNNAGLTDNIFASLLGKNTKTRFRPHYFGYTEPSFEVDLTAAHLPKVKKPWIEIGGCGMVDPTVFEAVGYDPEVWSGYAFGMGLERLAMLMYGIDDIRYFYQNDLRFLRQFA